MNQTITAVAIVFILFGCRTEPRDEYQRDWAIALHGGAGHFGEENYPEELAVLYRLAMKQALDAGVSALDEGATAVDVVELVIRELEACSLFNAGRGAVFTSEGLNELDASIMDGHTRNCGAVTGIKNIAHPVSAARLVMEQSEHVFFSGSGAREFALAQGLDSVPDAYFYTDKAWERYVKRAEQDKHGTVGCAVLDRAGHLAAATSTGGMTYKRHGRIGDSPVIGAGTWADDRTCAVSATGWGEYFIRTGVTQDIHGRMLYGGRDLLTACDETIFDEMGALGGDGGVIAVDHRGRISMVFNSTGMFRAFAYAGEDGKPVGEVMMFGSEGKGNRDER